MSLSKIYLRIATAAPTISEKMQEQIHRFAMSESDAPIAAALARRSDTIDTIDSELGGWSEATVQAAWFARPGRTAAAATEKVAKEKRVTVLEVVAALDGLPADVYKQCLSRSSARVAMPLLANDAVSDDIRAAAATILVESMSNLSYSRRQLVLATLSTCSTPVMSAAVQSARKIEQISTLLKASGNIDMDAAKHCVKAARAVLRKVPEARRTAIHVATQQAQQQPQRYRYSRHYEFHGDLREVLSVIESLTGLPIGEKVNVAAIEDLAKLIEHEIEQSISTVMDDQQLISALQQLQALCQATGNGSVRDVTAEVRDATTAEHIAGILERSPERQVAVAALCNRYADATVAKAAIQLLGYAEPRALLRARAKDMSLATKVAIMQTSYMFNDEIIQEVAAPSDPADLWAALVRATADNNYMRDDLMNSSFVRPGVVPTLPLKMFEAPNMPEWAIAELAAYLDEHLKSQSAWDGFNVLCRNHLGDVQTVVRAACRTARP